MDQFGTLDDAIEFAAKRVGLEENPTVYYSSPEAGALVGEGVFRGDWQTFADLATGLAPLRMVALSAPVREGRLFDIDSQPQIVSSVVRGML